MGVETRGELCKARGVMVGILKYSIDISMSARKQRITQSPMLRYACETEATNDAKITELEATAWSA